MSGRRKRETPTRTNAATARAEAKSTTAHAPTSNYQAPDDRYQNNSSKARHGQSLSPQQAAQRARSQYGGQVLKVQPAGDGYQVRLLQEDGRVVTVSIGD